MLFNSPDPSDRPTSATRPKPTYENQIAVGKALLKDTGTKVYFDDDEMIRQSDNKVLSRNWHMKSYNKLVEEIKASEGDHPKRSSMRRAMQIIGHYGTTFREFPPKDIDELWDAINDDLDDLRWAINYQYMADGSDNPQWYGPQEYEDAGRDKIEYEELEWFISEEDIVTIEDMQEAGHIADDGTPATSMDRNDPMYDPDDRIFLVDVDEDDDSNEYTIEVGGKDAACSDALAALHACRGGLMNLIQSEELSPKNAYVNEIRTRLFMIEGYLNGIRGCTHIIDEQQVM